MSNNIETAITLIISRVDGYWISNTSMLPILRQSGFDDNFIKTFENWIRRCKMIKDGQILAGDFINCLFRVAFYIAIGCNKDMAALFDYSRINIGRYISEKCTGGLSANTVIDQDETKAFTEICRLNRIYSDSERISVNKYHSIFIKAAKTALRMFPNMSVDDFMIKYQLEIIRIISL